MSETYLVSAKTVEEAIAIANREYADETHEVSYEIIDMPKKGFLGIGSRDAKIKITVTKIESADLGSIVNELRGMKSITSRGDDDNKKQNQQKNQQKQKPQQNNQNNQKKDQQKPAENQQKPKKDQPKQNNKPAENKQASTPAEKTAEKPLDKPAAKPETTSDAKFGDANAEYKTSLHNDVKTGKRKNQIPKNYNPQTTSDENQNEAVTVSAPVGLSDFVSENKSFGASDDGISYTRMSNDVRKKKSAPQQASQTPAQPAEKPAQTETAGV